MSEIDEKWQATMEEFARKVIITERVGHAAQIIESMPELPEELRTEAEALFERMVASLRQ